MRDFMHSDQPQKQCKSKSNAMKLLSAGIIPFAAMAASTSRRHFEFLKSNLKKSTGLCQVEIRNRAHAQVMILIL